MRAFSLRFASAAFCASFAAILCLLAVLRFLLLACGFLVVCLFFADDFFFELFEEPFSRGCAEAPNRGKDRGVDELLDRHATNVARKRRMH